MYNDSEGLIYAGGALWVANSGGNDVAEINPTSSARCL
jgi:hypothetical protein